MYEILNISIGHRPNHLSTQFFNCQEELLGRQGEKLNDPTVFLQPCVDRISKTVSYSPRALLWDAKTGFGALGTYQYNQPSDYYYGEERIEGEHKEVITTYERIPRSEYQNALDSGSPRLPKLSRETTKYWSDYAKLIYPSASFNVLRDWYHDVSQPNLPDFQKLETKRFDSYQVGCQEFNENYLNDFFDGNLHNQLEQCDTLQGFNIITDMDSGWGGFSASMLIEIRNELPKSSVFTWGFNEDDPLTIQTASSPGIKKSDMGKLSNKIRGTVSLAEESDIMIPLYASHELSNWEQAGLSCKLFESVNAVISQSNSSQRRSMEHMASSLTLSDTTRKFVSSISGLEQGVDSSFFSKLNSSKVKPTASHVFTSCNISRGVQLNQSPSESNATNLQTYAYCPSDTIPEKYSQETEFTLNLSSTEVCKDVFKQYENLVSKYFRHDGDREALKDELASLSSNYEYGWYDDEYSGDDDM